ncbi:hypothetical protein [Armatimonas sp.]|uniref:hypothetical protein n=1 Tax=Armatimonas sp. TaxID=1872638 RepID=UPI00286BF78E|nr:hypothetical protein [Armatimonas sp.]
MHSEGLAGKTETFLRYGVTPRLAVGFGYLHKQGYVRPLLSYTLTPETPKIPSTTLGLMTDSLGGGRQGAFMTFGKALPGLPASVYIGPAKITGEPRFRLLAGINGRIGKNFSASVQLDGRYANVGLVSTVGQVSGIPLRLGIVAAHGNRFGPLAAWNIPLKP